MKMYLNIKISLNVKLSLKRKMSPNANISLNIKTPLNISIEFCTSWATISSLSSFLYCLLKTKIIKRRMKQLFNKHSEWWFNPVAFINLKYLLPLKYMLWSKNVLFQLFTMNIDGKQWPRGVSWNQIMSEKIDTLYLLSALKEPVQIDYEKTCSVTEQEWISTCCWHI